MRTPHPAFWRGWLHHLAQVFLGVALVDGFFMAWVLVVMVPGLLCDPCMGGREGGGLPMIWSEGADGLPGGEGLDADLYNISPLPPWMDESDLPLLDSASSAILYR